MSKIFGDRFYFARHGETENNALGLVTGTRDVPLNDVGKKQATRARHCVSTLGIKSCVCSPLKRAVDTAELMLQTTEVTPIPIDGIKERDWGKLECIDKNQLDNFAFANMGVEIWDDFVKRNIEALVSLSIENPFFIVAHSGTFRALCDYLRINIEKKPVLNAWPYIFFKTNSVWNVTVVGSAKHS